MKYSYYKYNKSFKRFREKLAELEPAVNDMNNLMLNINRTERRLTMLSFYYLIIKR